MPRGKRKGMMTRMLDDEHRRQERHNQSLERKERAYKKRRERQENEAYSHRSYRNSSSRSQETAHRFLDSPAPTGWESSWWVKVLTLLSVIPAFYFISNVGLFLICAIMFPAVTRVMLWGTISLFYVLSSLFQDTSDQSENTGPIEAQAPRDIQEQPMPLMKLSPAEFENEIAWVFEQLYSVKAEVTGKVGDEGIDIKAYDNLGTLRGIIQAKRYNPNRALPPGCLRDLDSCRRRLGVGRAFLVTTAYFSEDTRLKATEWRIDLIDGTHFEQMRQKARNKVQLQLVTPNTSAVPISKYEEPPDTPQLKQDKSVWNKFV